MSKYGESYYRHPLTLSRPDDLIENVPYVIHREPLGPINPMTLLRAYGPPKPETWEILDRSDHLGPCWIVRDRGYCGYSPIYVNDVETALKVWWRRSVA